MKISAITGLALTLLSINLFGQPAADSTGSQLVFIEWKEGKPAGSVGVLNGELSEIKISRGSGKIKENKFAFRSAGHNRLMVAVHSVRNKPGPGATLVTIHTENHPFSFLLRDVSEVYPVYIPEYKVVVLKNGDNRSYEEVEATIQSKGLTSKLEQIENEPEVSFESVQSHTRNQTVPAWLGISRDIRIFEITQSLEDSPAETDIISPKYASDPLVLDETNGHAVTYLFATGRGQGVEPAVSRRLENGVLPILHTIQIDGEISYHSIMFASLESLPLRKDTPIGTDFLVADYHSAGHMFTEEQQETVNEKLAAFEKDQAEQNVLYCRVEATNKGEVPRYAWFKTPRPGRGWWDRIDYTFDPVNGFSMYPGDRVFCVSKLNGAPLPDEEMAILLKPDETAAFEFYIPHAPVSKERAFRLAGQQFEARHAEAGKFWWTKLDDAAQIRLPEKRIEEMIQAGLLHLDLITCGKEPGGTLAPLIGIYSPIGTESSPIIQFYCSMGLQDLARRSLMYFLDKQHDDGIIQNFNGYMVETGAALWTMGEYFRYSNDEEWVKLVKPKLLKSCDYLLRWRDRNKTADLQDRGYGMIDGRVADPEDPYHQFMLNAYGYIGLSRVAEMLQSIDPGQSGRLEEEAGKWKKDILASFYSSMARSPVVPLGDGSWCPTVAPWPETVGPRSLFVNRGPFFSHGTFTVPDVLLGPLYLVFCEVLEPDCQASEMMLQYHSELFYQDNCAFSQPYYSRHNWIQLKQGLVKPFLKTYYSTFSALADRETYTFWEHLYHASPHKTHEEGWFLMETRWMLYMEEGETLSLLPGIPRKWLENGQTIELINAASYFGPFSLRVDSHVKEGYIEAVIHCNTNRKPGIVTIRLPHPEGKKPSKTEGGMYNESSETVTIHSFSGQAILRMEF
jgi:hypothetical protein